ncbi:unnamed protein product [Closterium sp. NIES-53]
MHRILSSQDITIDKSVGYYHLHPHSTSPVPRPPPPPSLPSSRPPPADPLPPQSLAPSGVSLVDPPPLVEPLEVSSDTSGPAEGGDSAAYDTAATPRSLRLETPPRFLPWPSSPPPQPVAVDSGAVGGGDTGGADLGGAGPGGADFGGAGPGSAESGVACSGGAGSWSGQQQLSRRQETLSS